VKNTGDGYEADTDENEDDSETPKKKKGDKPKVRDLIEAQRDELAIPKAPEDLDMEVSVKLELRVYLTFLFDQVCEVDSVEATTCVPR
jgi:hypothetical protein